MGIKEGLFVGSTLGLNDGTRVGNVEGEGVGISVGDDELGCKVGLAVGITVGSSVGEYVGYSEGHEDETAYIIKAKFFGKLIFLTNRRRWRRRLRHGHRRTRHAFTKYPSR